MFYWNAIFVGVPDFAFESEHCCPNAHCGIYSVYGAAAACGESSTEFVELVDTRFVGSRKGSTISELIAAAEFLGVNATPLHHLSEISLYNAVDPLILHFASYGQLEVYDHWVLFLGIEEDQAVILDAASGEFLVPVSEVLLRWDGIAIAIHAESRPKLYFRNFNPKELAAGRLYRFACTSMKSWLPPNQFSFLQVLLLFFVLVWHGGVIQFTCDMFT